MIVWRLVKRGVDGDHDGKPVEIPFEGKTLGEIAPPSAVGCIMLGKFVRRDDPEWSHIVPDGSVLQFVETDAGIETIAIALIAAYIAASSAAAAALVSIGVGAAAATVIASVAVSAASIAVVGAVGYGIYKGFRALFPTAPGIPGISTSTSGNRGKNFGFGGIANTIEDGAPVPVVYGEHRVGGAILAAWNTANGNGDEVAHYMICVSEGPIHSIGTATSDQDELMTTKPNEHGGPPGTTNTMIEDVWFNGIAARDMKGLTLSLRMGSSSQTVMPGFENIINAYSQDFEMKQDQGFNWQTRNNVHEVMLHFTFPQGLFSIDTLSGTHNRLRVTILVEIFDEFGAIKAAADQEFVYGNKKAKGQFWWDYYVELPSYGKYTIRVTRTDKEQHITDTSKFDEFRLVAVNEIRRFAIAHRNKALLGVTLRASDQTSGGIPTTVSLVRGRKVYNPVTDSTGFSRNPAWCIRDWLLNSRYGLGSRIVESMLDESAFSDWAEYNDELIDPWTDAPVVSQLIPATSNDLGVIPAVSGSWTPTDNWGTWSAEVTAFSAGVSVTIDWTYTPDVEANGMAATYQTVHTSTSAQTIAFGLSAVANPALTWEVGDSWDFRVLKEPRNRLDIVLDSFQSAWKLALDMARTARAALMRVGSEITVSVENVKLPVAMFSENANIQDGSLKRGLQSKGSRSNIVEIQFLNGFNRYESDKVVVETEGVSADVELPRRLSLAVPGITRRTQALRFAAFMARAETLQRGTLSFIGGLDACTLLPGNVIKINQHEMDHSWTGRVAGFEEGVSTTLDQEITFSSGVVYQYVERQIDGTLWSDEFVYNGTTDTIPVAPEDDDPRGNPFIVGPTDVATELWLVVAIGNVGADGTRKIEAISYLDEIFGDDAPADTSGFESPTFAGAPANVTDATVVESVVNARSSRLTVSWVESAGSPEAVRYVVWMKALGSPFAIVGETTGDSVAIVVEYDTGVPVTFAIQPVAADGSRLVPSLVTHVTYVIHRDGNNLIVFPPTMTGFAITPGIGNAATLSWDDLGSDADGYEIRIHTWHEGRTIYRGSSTSKAVTLSNVVERYYARAYNTVSGTRYYSPIAAVVESVATPLSPYTSSEESGDIDFSAGGALENFAVHTWTQDQGNDTDTALLQISRDGPATWTSEAYDLGSQADTLVSVDFRILPYQVFPAEDISPAMEHVSAYGRINEEYLNWKLFVETSNNGTSWTRDRIDNDFNSNIVKNKRYFRFRAEVRLIRFSEGASYPCLAMAVRCKFDLSREP